MSGYRAPPDSEGLQRVSRDTKGLGLHVVRDDDTTKEAYNMAGLQPDDYSRLIATQDRKSAPPPDYQGHFGTAYGAALGKPEQQLQHLQEQQQQPPPPMPWWKRKRYMITGAVALLVLLALVIAVPIAVIKGKGSGSSLASSSPDTSGGSITNTPSTSGAFNGTGLAAFVPGDTSEGEAILFYQHFDGSLRQSILSNGTWTSGNNPIVAQGNVRNGTPIAAWPYKVGNDDIWHVAWVDDKNMLQDVTKTNATGDWVPGKLGDGNFEASSSTTTSLSMARFNLYNNGHQIDGLGTIRVFYGDTGGIVKELSFADDSTSWNVSHVFPETVNGHVGFSAQVPSGLAFIFYADKDHNSLGYYYQEQDIAGTNPAFSNGDWTAAATTAATTLRNNSGISYLSATFAVFQDPSDQIITIKPNFEIPSGPWGSSQQIGSGVPNTRIASTAPKSATGLGPLIYFQENGDDVVQWQQNTKDLSWSKSSVTVN